MPAEERHLAAAEDGFFRGMLERRLIGVRRPPLPGQLPRGIDVGEIGSDRLAIAIDQPVGGGDPAGEDERADGKHDQAVAADARGGQPFAGTEPLPDICHFAAELFRMLRRPYCRAFNVP